MAEQAKAWRVRSSEEYHPRRRVLILHSVPCEVRAQSVKFSERILAFGCNVVMARDDVRFTRDDAITQFVVGRLAEIDRLRAQIAIAEAEVDAARTLTEADPLAVVAEREG